MDGWGGGGGGGGGGKDAEALVWSTFSKNQEGSPLHLQQRIGLIQTNHSVSVAVGAKSKLCECEGYNTGKCVIC